MATSPLRRLCRPRSVPDILCRLQCRRVTYCPTSSPPLRPTPTLSIQPQSLSILIATFQTLLGHHLALYALLAHRHPGRPDPRSSEAGVIGWSLACFRFLVFLAPHAKVGSPRNDDEFSSPRLPDLALDIDQIGRRVGLSRVQSSSVLHSSILEVSNPRRQSRSPFPGFSEPPAAELSPGANGSTSSLALRIGSVTTRQQATNSPRILMVTP